MTPERLSWRPTEGRTEDTRSSRLADSPPRHPKKRVEDFLEQQDVERMLEYQQAW